MQNLIKVGANKFSNKRDWLNQLSTDIKQDARNQEEWRAELKKGDYIDAINFYETSQNPNCKHIAGWSPAKIVFADNQDNLLVTFLRCPKNTQRKMQRGSDQIAQFGKFTDNWNWRFDIQEETVFDCCDEYGNWYRSTCLKITQDPSIVDIDGNSVPQLMVAFRCLDPNGLKEDDKQRKCTGWISAKYDTEMQLSQPNIQPLNNLTYQYFDVGQGKMQYDITVAQDIDDIIYPTSTIRQWARKRANQFAGLQFFADILNEFGELGGFELIVDLFTQIATGEFETSIAHFLTLHQILRKTLQLWTRQFLCHYIPLVQNAFEKVITSEKSSVLKQIEKDTFSGLVENYKDLMKRNNTSKRIQQMTNTLNIKIGGLLLKSTNLPKRIQGIKMLSDEVRTARHSGTMISREVMQDLLNADILSLVFSPQKFHLQIVQRSQEIIKLYASEKQLTQDHLEMIWEATLVDETALIEVYKIIQETSQILPDVIIEQFIFKIRDQMDPQKVTIREVDFVHQIGKNAYAKSSARQSAYNVLWSIFMMERPGYSKNLLKQSRKHFFDLLRNADRDLIELHIHMAIDVIKSNKGASVQALKIIIKLIDTLPKFVYASTIGRSLKQFVADTETNYNLIDSILDNLEYYLKGQSIDEGYNHQKNVQNRLKAIRFILENVDDKKTLTANQVERAWNILFNQSSDDNDAVLLFDWFSQVLNNHEWVQSNTDVICNIFQQYVLSNTHKLLNQGVHSNAFQCIQTLFIVVNENQNLINVITRNTNASLIDKSKRPKPTFRVNVIPKQLVGIEIIWQFFVSSCYKRDYELQQNVIAFLTSLYLSQSNFLENKKQEIYKEFTQECFSRMDSALEQTDVLSSEKAEIIKNSMQIFLTFFEECEKKGGTGNIRPHAALDSQVYYIENLLATSYLSDKSQPKYIVLSLPSNMTLWELIDYIAKKLNKSPLKIQVKRDRKDKQELTSNDYCKSLRMLGFESNEELMVMKQQVNFTKVPLINPLSGLLVQEAQMIFTNWFNTFSIPAAEVQNLDLTKSPEAERYMTKETATQFLQNALSTQSATGFLTQLQPDDKRIAKLFQENDLDHDDLLTLDDFLRFYRLSSFQKPDVVWSNLQSFCYGQDLAPELRGEITYTNDPNLTVDQNQLPRSQIAENLEYLEKLFSIQTEDVRTQEKIWHLISSLKTNSSIYQQVLSSTNLKELFDPNQPVLKLMYNLQIAKHFLQQETAQRIAMQPIVKLYIEKGKEVAGSSNYWKEFPKIGDAVEDGEQGFQSASQTKGKSSQVLGAISELNEEPERDIKYKNLGAGSHWEKPQVSVANDQVIALPAAEFPQDQQQDTAATTKTSLTYNQQQIAGWKGQIICENAPFPSYCVKNEFIWLVQFLENKGFQILVKLLEFFVKNNELKSHAQKNCVKQITQMIKIILMVTLTANSSDIELANTLVRKMSSQDASQGNNAQVQQGPNQQQANDEFFMLIEQVKLYDISHMDLLENDPEMNQIQQLLQNTFQAILKNKQSSTDEERAIVSDCLNIWINLITFKTNQIMILYNDIGYINLLIEQGLLAENEQMRTQFKDAIEFISFHIKHEGLPLSPARFFLNVLVNKLVHISDNIHINRTAQYFALTNSLFSAYFTQRKIALQFPNVEFQDICDHKVLIVQALELLNRLKVQEVRLNGLPDNTLVGLLQFVKIILTNEKPDLLNDDERFIVLSMLLEKCLFSKNNAVITDHITKDINIQEISQSNMNKCHSRQSREAAYSLLESVIGENPNPDMLTRLIKNFWAPLIMKLEKPIENQLAPVDRKRSSFGFSGMKNLGCICYMNSMIQQLYNVPAFRYLLMAADDQQPTNIVKRPNGKEIDDNNLHQWMRMFGFLELTDRQDYNPEDFCFSFKNGDQPTNVRVQQDAQEFLNVAFDRLESSLKDTPMKNLCQSVFQGQNSSLMICKSCGNISQRDEDFYCVQVQVKNQKDIYTSLKSMVAGEVIQGYKCSACNQTVDIEKKWAVKKLPNHLIVHLNRIVFDFDQMINIKLNDRFEFPNVLSMKEFMLEEIMKEVKSQNLHNIKQKETIEQEDFKNNDDEKNYVTEDQNMKNDEEQPTDNNEKEILTQQSEEFQYKLVGVVIHMGSANAGHYLSYINIERERDPKIDSAEWLKTEHQNWLEFNDSTVKPFDFKQLAFKCFGEQQSTNKNIMTSTNYQNDEIMTNSATTAQAAHNAYMLVYEKQIKSDISILLDQRTVDAIQQNSVSLACDGTTIPRAFNQPHSCIVYPKLAEKVLKEQLAPNTTIPIPFYDVQKFVPNSIYNQICDDNQVYTAELQVYDNHFFKTTTQLLTSLVETRDSPQLLNDIYIVIDKLIFDLLFNQCQNKELPQLCKLMFTLTNKQPILLSKLVQDRILYKEKVQGATSEYPFFEILLFHKDQEIRETAEYILTQVTSIFFENLEYHNVRDLYEDTISQLQEGLNTIIEISLSFLTNQNQLTWHKIGAYLNYFYNLLKDKQWSRYITFNKKHLVQKLVELISKYKDIVTNGAHFSNPPFENAIKTISFMVRAQPLLIHLYKIPLEQQVTIEEYTQLIDEFGPSPFLRTVNEQTLFLDPEDIKSLFMADKKTKFFWEICINYSYTQDTREEVSQMIQHVCYKNYDLSKKIAKILISGLNRTNADDIKPYAVCMEGFLSIPDQFQKVRIEWLLGLPSIQMTRPTNQHYYSEDHRPQIHKIGVGNINDVTDIIHDYNVPFLKDSSNNTQESVLRILYKYRKSGFQEVVLVLIDYLLKAAVNDKTGNLLDFLLQVEGPSYACNRYYDWIEPFITQLIQDNFAGSNQSQQLMEICFRIFGHITKIKEDYNHKLCDNYKKEPYLIWSITSSDDLTTTINHNKNFHVVIAEYQTQISNSTPNSQNQTNENLNKIVRGGWQTTFQLQAPIRRHHVSPKQTATTSIARSFGRGQRKIPTKPNLPKVYTHKNSGMEIEDINGNEDENENFPQEEPLPRITVHNTASDEQQPLMQNQGSQDVGDNWSDKNNNGSDDDGGYVKNLNIKNNDFFDTKNIVIETAVIQDDNLALNQSKSQDSTGNWPAGYQYTTQLDQAQDAQNSPVPEEKMLFNSDNENDQIIPPPQEDNMEFDDAQQTQFYSQDQPEEEKIEPEVEDDVPRKTIEGTILQFTLRNFSKTKVQKCTLIFEESDSANYYVPQSEINCCVNTTTDQTFTRLLKLRPHEPWGEVKFRFLVDGEDLDGYDQKLRFNWPQLRALRVEMPLPEPDPAPPSQPFVSIPPTDPPVGEISCMICTYFNLQTANYCEMCGTAL